MTNTVGFGSEQRLSVEEAAALLGVSPRWMWRAVKYGKIPHQRVGKLIRIRRGDLEGDIGAPGYIPKSELERRRSDNDQQEDQSA